MRSESDSTDSSQLINYVMLGYRLGKEESAGRKILSTINKYQLFHRTNRENNKSVVKREREREREDG